MANQDPWCDSRKEFFDNLDRLETGSLYKTTFQNQILVEFNLDTLKE